ncbi:concanavalin A-like lectin/glucanase domain-containing protein [Fennellomyces sp. T-0311]|nr:concanavalin A-like lectin/glucanase domain-containing protein [Fennellomyces sp. T-0311]
MPDYFEEEPPSYHHAFQAGLQPDNVVHATGRYQDASVDSFQRGELFIQAFRSQINGPIPPEILGQVRERGLVHVLHWDQATHGNALFKHPLASSRQEPFRITSNNTVQFWPGLRRRGDTDWDITVQASHPYLMDYGNGMQHALHYFEVTVEVATSDVVVAIGLTTRPYPLFRMPGWNKHSVGYMSDDGRTFFDDPTGGQDYGPTWKQGDTVGCGYSPTQGTVYFTKNGHNLGVAYASMAPLNYYASIAADGAATVSVNFGTRPFRYYPPPDY